MVKIDRSFVLKNFLDRVYDAKRMNMPELKMSIKELDELAYVIYQLMSEDMSKILEYIDKTNAESTPVKVKKKSDVKIIQPIKVNKVVSEKVEKLDIEKVEEPPYNKAEEISEQDKESIEESFDDLGGGYLYGGTF